jgi:hypothetical protein
MNHFIAGLDALVLLANHLIDLWNKIRTVLRKPTP